MHIHKHYLIAVWHPDVTEIKRDKIAGKESVVWNCHGTLCEYRFLKDTFIDLTTVLWLDNSMVIYWHRSPNCSLNRQRMFVWVWVFAFLYFSDCAALLKAFNRFFYIRVWFNLRHNFRDGCLNSVNGYFWRHTPSTLQLIFVCEGVCAMFRIDSNHTINYYKWSMQ